MQQKSFICVKVLFPDEYAKISFAGIKVSVGSDPSLLSGKRIADRTSVTEAADTHVRESLSPDSIISLTLL
jgi:hypothetical protein